LATLAATFQSLADRKLLNLGDPLLAANHFVGLLLWIPVNKAMFTGDHCATSNELECYALAAVQAFLNGYGPSRVMPAQKEAATRTRRKG
jgi:TetR/AcrR family transcriptional repressor of mexJK operon